MGGFGVRPCSCLYHRYLYTPPLNLHPRHLPSLRFSHFPSGVNCLYENFLCLSRSRSCSGDEVDGLTLCRWDHVPLSDKGVSFFHSLFSEELKLCVFLFLSFPPLLSLSVCTCVYVCVSTYRTQSPVGLNPVFPYVRRSEWLCVLSPFGISGLSSSLLSLPSVLWVGIFLFRDVSGRWN